MRIEPQHRQLAVRESARHFEPGHSCGSDCPFFKAAEAPKPSLDSLDEGSARRSRRLIEIREERVRELPDRQRISEIHEVSEEPDGIKIRVKELEYDLMRRPEEARAALGVLDPERLLHLLDEP